MPTQTTRPPAARTVLLSDFAAFGVHDVVFGVVRLHGQKRTRSHVQGHCRAGDAGGIEPREEFRREVKARRRRGDGAVMRGEHGLIIAGVARVCGTARRDVGRQRHDSGRRDRLVERRATAIEAQHDLAVGVLFIHVGGQSHAERNAVADREFTARLGECRPRACVDALVERDFDARVRARTTRRAQARKLRRDHARIVEDEAVAPAQIARQVAHLRLFELRGALVHDQQARGIARDGGAQRNQLFGKFKIEIRYAQLTTWTFPA